MVDRGMKKWRPFNSVVSLKELKRREEKVEVPVLLDDVALEFEEILKASFYTQTPVTITYVEGNEVKELRDYVVKFDPVRKDVFFRTKKINFRQIIKIQ